MGGEGRGSGCIGNDQSFLLPNELKGVSQEDLRSYFKFYQEYGLSDFKFRVIHFVGQAAFSDDKTVSVRLKAPEKALYKK